MTPPGASPRWPVVCNAQGMGRPSKVTVLLVDDEDSERLKTTRILRKEGYRVLEAVGYWEALAKFHEHQARVSLLICDIALPERNGCDLAIVMTAEKPRLRVMFVSGKVGAEVCKYYGLELSDVHFLSKPFSESTFLKRLHAVVASPEGLTMNHDARKLTVSARVQAWYW